MNILIVTESFPPNCGGSGWSTFYLCKVLKENGLNITVAKINGKENNYKGIDIISIKTKENIKNIIKRYKIDLLHSQHMKSTVISSGLKTPLVVTLRDYWPLCYKGTLFNDKKQKNIKKSNYQYNLSCIYHENNILVKILSPFAALYMSFRTKKGLKSIKKAAKIICVSNFVKNKINVSIKSNKLIVIPNMIDYNQLQKITPKKFYKKTILFVGKLMPSKGPQILPKSLKGIKDIQLILIGNGKLKRSIENDLKKRNIDFKIIDYLDNNEVLRYMKGADILVIPPLWHEPLGRTILEGLAVGAKIIATNTGGTKEIIKNNYNGLLCSSSSEDLNRAIRLLLYNKKLQDELSNNAKKTAQDNYDKNQVIKKIQKIYLSIVKK
jgi:glycogen synthase